ncbi:ABC transporter ATP-binding protein [Helicobacter cholecystus]|uniref:ABC transporter ATP-binding protein n=1 Tax=Helicobacter cholecystus TaxID=45498 RepID=A0A3D8IWH6_9HELI|nr:ABC transporter ATP-binding protein [Helicobacter cholecystus]RDU69592.1 ABC transporter ATP-binding protein [Helicobacter cholecystus]VEJ24150.1 ABC transporter [Helicobacter cholecystus]
MSFINLQGIRKTYGKGENAFEVLKGVDLEIHKGDFISLMGPSGSGKSTLSNILGCLDEADGGIYDFCGVNVCELDFNQKARLRRNYFGFIFQSFNLLPKTTALENVELPLIYKGMKKKQRRELAFQALAKVGLERWANHTSAQLSGGQQQRVAIARALVISPLFLIADEPTGNLDTQRSIEIMEILQGLNQEGITILMVTHESNMASYASREIHFLDGKIQKEIKR